VTIFRRGVFSFERAYHCVRTCVRACVRAYVRLAYFCAGGSVYIALHHAAARARKDFGDARNRKHSCKTLHVAIEWHVIGESSFPVQKYVSTFVEILFRHSKVSFCKR